MRRLKELRREMGLSQSELGQRLGVKQNTVSQWESGVRQADADALCQLADFFQVSIDYLLEREAYDWAVPIRRAYLDATTQQRRKACSVLGIAPVLPGAAPGRISLPVYMDPAAAGIPLDASDAWESLDFAQGEVPQGADFGVRIRGSSMEPAIHDGQIVWVHRQADIPNGEVGVFMLEDGAVCKRLRLDENGQILRLESDNPDFPDISGDALVGLRAVGRVVG